MISRVLAETLVVRELDAAAAAWREELGWETLAEGPVEEPLRELWMTDRGLHPRFALLRSPGSARGFVRLVEGPEDDRSPSFHRAGLFNAELLCADVDRLYARLEGSQTFRPVSGLNTYDLGATGGAVSRSFATRGPGGAGVLFTTYLAVPPPRTLPRCDHLVGPMFNSALATESAEAMAAFFEGTLGMARRFEGRLAQASINRILGLPEDWGFHMVVYKGEGDGLVEVDLHEHPLPPAPGVEAALPPGNAFLTLETPDLDAVLERAAARGFATSPVRAVAALPYAGRRAGLVRGPARERFELIESI